MKKKRFHFKNKETGKQTNKNDSYAHTQPHAYRNSFENNLSKM